MPLIAIMRGFSLESVAPIVEAIGRGGLRTLEITMNTPGAEDQIRRATDAARGSGMQIGAGYEGSLGDMAFWRAEGSYQMWDDLSANGSESNAVTGDTTKNKIVAELGSVTGTLSVGMKF